MNPKEQPAYFKSWRPVTLGHALHIYPIRMLACVALGMVLFASLPRSEHWIVITRNVLFVAYPVLELIILAWTIWRSPRRSRLTP